MALALLPMASALPEETPFPDISFQEFSQFISQNFNPTISLASVLCMLFSITENPDLLALHTRQQNARFPGEHSTMVSAWIWCLSRSIQNKLCVNGKTLLNASEEGPNVPNDQTITILGTKLDTLADILQLKPFVKNGKVKKKLLPTSYKAIEAVHVICPDSFQCETLNCKPCSLQQITKARDIPSVTLIKGFTIYENCPLLTGKCQDCKTLYLADHEWAPMENDPN